jgi:hypothetical protein
MRLLRRKKKGEDEGQDPSGPDPQGNEAAGTDVVPPTPDRQEPESVNEAPVSADGEDADAFEEQAPVDPALAILEEDDDEPGAAASPPAGAPPFDGDGDERLPASFYFDGLLKIKDDRPPSREELDRQAEADFHAAIAPSVGPLHEIVPDAASPEDALQKLTETWDEPLPDPEGEATRGQDPYKRGPADTAVYYRIRRHFDSPRRHVGFGREAWRPPAGLAGEPTPRRGRSRPALTSGKRSRES